MGADGPAQKRAYYPGRRRHPTVANRAGGGVGGGGAPRGLRR